MMLLLMKEPIPPALHPHGAADREGVYRACPEHGFELLEQASSNPLVINLWCPESHVIRPHAREPEAWCLVLRRTGKRVATCTRAGTTFALWYLRAIGEPVDEPAVVDEPTPARPGPSPQVAPAVQESPLPVPAEDTARQRRLARRRETRYRAEERAAALAEGRAPEEWAAMRQQPATPASLAAQKRASRVRAEARAAAIAAGQPVPEWARRRIGRAWPTKSRG